MIVEMIAQPILEAIEALEQNHHGELFLTVPQLKIVWQDPGEPVEIDGHLLDEAIIRQVEAYLQDRICSLEHPTVLH